MQGIPARLFCTPYIIYSIYWYTQYEMYYSIYTIYYRYTGMSKHTDQCGRAVLFGNRRERLWRGCEKTSFAFPWLCSDLNCFVTCTSRSAQDLQMKMKIAPFKLFLISLIFRQTIGQECASDGTCDSHERCAVWKDEGECYRNAVRLLLLSSPKVLHTTR